MSRRGRRTGSGRGCPRPRRTRCPAAARAAGSHLSSAFFGWGTGLPWETSCTSETQAGAAGSSAGSTSSTSRVKTWPCSGWSSFTVCTPSVSATEKVLARAVGPQHELPRPRRGVEGRGVGLVPGADAHLVHHRHRGEAEAQRVGLRVALAEHQAVFRFPSTSCRGWKWAGLLACSYQSVACT